MEGEPRPHDVGYNRHHAWMTDERTKVRHFAGTTAWCSVRWRRLQRVDVGFEDRAFRVIKKAWENKIAVCTKRLDLRWIKKTRNQAASHLLSGEVIGGIHALNGLLLRALRYWRMYPRFSPTREEEQAGY